MSSEITSLYSSFLRSVGDCSRVAALPLNQLQSLRDRNPRGVITLPLFIEGVPTGGGSIYTARDHCFVIASMGIKEKRALRLFFCYSHSTRTVNFELNILTLLSIL